MDFGAIVNRAIFLVKNTPVLWKLGLLAIFTEGMVNVFNFSLPQQEKPEPELELATRKLNEWVQNNIDLAIALMVLGLVIMVVLWYFSTRAKISLMLAVDQLEDKKDANSFKAYFSEAKPTTWRILGLNLLTVGTIALVIGLLSVTLFLNPQTGMIAFLVALPILLVAAFYLSFMLKMVERKMVLDNGSMLEGLRFTHQLLKARFSQVLIAIVLEVGLSILFSITVAAAILVAIGIGALIIILLSAALPKAALVFIGIILAFTMIIGLYFLAAVYASFINSYWTLIYRAFRYLINIKEENGRE